MNKNVEHTLSVDELTEFVVGTEELLQKHNISAHSLGQALGYLNPTHLNRVLRLEGGAHISKLKRLRQLLEADKDGDFKQVLAALKRRAKASPDRKRPSKPKIGGSSGKYLLERPVMVVDDMISLEECSFLNTRRVTEEQGELAREIMADLLKKLVGKAKPLRFKYQLWETMGYLGTGGSEVSRNVANPTAWKFVRLLAIKNAVEMHGPNAALWFARGEPHGMDKPIPFEFLKEGEAGVEYHVVEKAGEVEGKAPAVEERTVEATLQEEVAKPEPPTPEVEANGATPKKAPIPARSMKWVEAVATIDQTYRKLQQMGHELSSMHAYLDEVVEKADMPSILRKSGREVTKVVAQVADDFEDNLSELHNLLSEN